MTEKRKKYFIEIQKAYEGMVQALVNSEQENAEQTLMALNAVSKLFFAEQEFQRKAFEPYGGETKEEGIKLIRPSH